MQLCCNFPRMHSVFLDRLSARDQESRQKRPFVTSKTIYFSNPKGIGSFKNNDIKKAKITVFFVRHRIDNEESFETLGQTAPFNTKASVTTVLSKTHWSLNTTTFFVHLYSCLPLHCIHICLNDIQVSLSSPHHMFIALKCPKVLNSATVNIAQSSLKYTQSSHFLLCIMCIPHLNLSINKK